MNINIIKVYDHYFPNEGDYYGGGTNYQSIGPGTGWEEVTDEEFNLLKKWVQQQNVKSYINGYKLVILQEHKVDIKQSISEMLEQAKIDQEKISNKQKEAEKRLQQRQAAKQKSKEEKEKKKLAELKKKYES